MKDLLLAIDNGTQSLRALVFDLQGNVQAKAQIEIEPYFSTHPGWAEQHATLYWQTLCDACQQLWKQGIDPQRIAGMAVTSQRGTMVNVDRQGVPLRPAITWLDQRLAETPPTLSRAWRAALKLAGASDLVATFQRQAKINWIAENQPELLAKTHKYLQLSGYLNFQLTGKYLDSTGSQVGYVPFDFKRRQWAGRFDWKWQALPLLPEQMAELVEPGDIIGAVTASAAEQTGLPAGLTVLAAAADKACEILAAGGLEEGVGCLSYGTTATYNTMTKRYFEPIKLLPPYPAAVPGYYYSEIMIYRGYWMVSWFKQQFGLREQQLAQEQGVAPESLFDELVEDIPAGSMGLMLQPYWSPGTREPGPEAKGAIIGFGDVHTRGHVYRAILEGLAYALREGRERTEKASKRQVHELRVSGGGSQSDVAMQLTADIFNLPAVRPHTYETSGLGAAMNIAVSLGLHSDYHAAAAAMCRPGKRFEPQADARDIYEQLYQRVYRKLYPQLQDIYKDIRAITGYPK